VRLVLYLDTLVVVAVLNREDYTDVGLRRGIVLYCIVVAGLDYAHGYEIVAHEGRVPVRGFAGERGPIVVHLRFSVVIHKSRFGTWFWD